MKVDTTAIEQEISNYEKQLRQAYSTKSKLLKKSTLLTQMTGITAGGNQTLMIGSMGCMIKLKN